MKIFIMNRYISRILLTDNIQSGGGCSVNYYELISVARDFRLPGVELALRLLLNLEQPY